ncbi:glycerol-3-phosphate dehydrogenase/oxidase [Solirubrobacter sp. CPCC 204708]|uniref:Glycerol-3-phosphate dehydrogenase n=1 Tax=Solirubrobacter deserti TaxID=2282478 RepID=A0ABT4REC3_9ACTN|nr:glycerol-3-phosphate dehydrogenase/oxidase [Solirubrobacter deserti]MBE2314668.1 glycerol-3-phosphate dehydrogenase/oxidase [Solirubrobacter deserti]MDA0136675.1 glycerol-3-phosphate dehydrogenase/oxidase [Solirubrobacter deserti]
MLPRADAVASLTREPFDVLVIGGGITGAGVALDAATRGYSVALVERNDYAGGTSSRSSKLVHGGLRYLQNFDLGLVREALLERQINVNLAPWLTKPLPLIVPAFEGQRLDRIVGLGLNAYDVMSVDRIRRRRRRDDSDWSPARHRIIPGEEVAQLLPALEGRAPTSGYLFYDCQTDDSRLVLTVLAEAERFGVVAANRVEVLELLEDGGRAIGARVRDAEAGEELEIRASTIVNATGVWADRLRPAELHDEAEVPVIRPSRGTHIIVDGDRLPMTAGAIVPAGAGRTIFVLPWLGQTLIGTTDTDHSGDVVHVRPTEEDVDYLLDAVNGFFATSLTPDDLAGAYAGVRPLISTGDRGKSVDISRKAELYETSSGMITITGGKLTTWRRMAKQTVDRIVERDGSDARCITHELPLGMAVEPDDLAAPEWAREQLAGRYGHVAHDVLAAGPAERIVDGRPDLLAEVVYAARREQARTLADVLLRRTRLGLTAARALTAPVLERVAGVLGDELGWDETRRARELDAFAQEAREEGILPAP